MAEFIDSDAATVIFGPHAKMARLDDGSHVIIDCDPGHLNAQAQSNVDELLTFINADRTDVTHIVRPTVILRCDENALPIDGDLTPLHTFPAGTSHEAALESIERTT